MASSSASVSHSESQSNTYIPEYSETPILQEIALHARAMSDTVYNWGMDRFNKNQGDIDGLMRDALSYASPQRIAVDMGMAEAGVQQAGERGRLSAIKDLESYGIDPSSGRYAQLDSANRVMTAASAAGAGNQQRMADQAAGNAMRQQALAAGMQNAQFGLGVGDSANKFLQTASSLKYPPLGRQSTSVSDSASGSRSTDPPKSDSSKDPKQQQPQVEKGAGAGREPKPGKPPAQLTKPPKGPQKPGPKEEPEDSLETGTGTIGPQIETPFYNPLGTDTANQPFQQAYDPSGQVSGITPEMQSGPYSRMGIGPNGETPAMGSEGPYSSVPEWPGTYTGMDMEFNPWAGGQTGVQPDQTAGDESAGLNTGRSQPDQTAGDESAGLNTNRPTAVQPDQTAGDESAGLNTGYRGPTDDNLDQMVPTDLGPRFDTPSPAADTNDVPIASYNPYEGNVSNASFTRGIDPTTGQPVNQGDEAETNADPAGSLYGVDPSGGGDWTLDVNAPTPADWGDDQTVNFGDQQGAYDSTFDTWTDAGGDYQAPQDVQYDDNYGDTGGDFTYDFGDQGQDYYGDQTYDYGDNTGDFTDAGDYNDPGYEYDDSGDTYDFGDDTSDFTDYDAYDDSGDDSYEDYADDSEEDYADDSGGEFEDDSGDYEDSGDEGYARGGQVRMRRGGMPTGFQQQRPQRPGRGLPPPPPGATGLAPRPQPPQPPRPQRGAPMAQPGGPQPGQMPRGPMMPGNMISANGMPPPTGQMPQRMARGGGAGRQEPTRGGFVSRELSPSSGSKVDDVQARLNAGEFVIPKDVAAFKGKEFFYKLIAQARKNRTGGGQPQQGQQAQRPQRPQTGYGPSRGMR